MTGMVTASWISLIFCGSAMRATPPSTRMSAGTRSSAMTDTAPASSAILACSAFVTSMITPPLSISARPVLTRSVATSAITLDCTARAAARPRPIPGTWLAALGEEAGDGVRERPRLLDEDEVPAVGEQHELGTVDTRSDLARVHGAADEVVLAGDHERLRPDPR